MDKVIGKLTVFFEDPFWVGVFERIENGRLSAAKVTFGAEPKEPELLIYLLRHKQARKPRSRARKQAEAKRLYTLKQQQKREKHKGH